MVAGFSLCWRMFTWNPLLPGPAPWWQDSACAGGCLPGIPCCQDLLHGGGVQPVLESVYLESLAARTCSTVAGFSLRWRMFTWNPLLPGPISSCRDTTCLEDVYLESLAARTCSMASGSSLCLRVFTWNPLLPGPAPWCRGPACAGGCLPGIPCCQDLLHGGVVLLVLECVYLESLAARTCSMVSGSSLCWRVFTWNPLMPGPAPW
jgi:hypothetical protein